MLVLKASSDIPTLYFGSLFCKCLKIDTPDCRIIEYTDPEFTEMILNIERVSINKHNLYNKVLYDLKERAFLLIYEYVPSLILYDFGISRAQSIFGANNFYSRNIFISLGKILGVDLLFNNYDRIPWIWNNAGNPANILFRIDLDLIPPNTNFMSPNYLDVYINSTVAIDSKPICLDPEKKESLKKLGEYLNSISEILKEFFYELKNVIIYGKNIDTYDFRCFGQINEFFLNSCGNNLSSKNLLHFSVGIITAINDIIEIDLNDIQILIDFVQNKTINTDWAFIFKNNADLLNLNYFKYIINFFCQLREDQEEIFNWIRDITQDIYKSNFKTEIIKILSYHSKFIYSDKDKISVHEDFEENILEKEKDNKIVTPYDDFNLNKNDKKRFGNDVHNGIYDVFDIDQSWIMEIKKRAYKFDESNKEIVISDIKPEINKLEISKIVIEEENEDPHKKYTIEELKEKIKKDELKQTLFMKKKLNPEEARFLEEKIKNVDESLLLENEEEMDKVNKSKDGKKLFQSIELNKSSNSKK